MDLPTLDQIRALREALAPLLEKWATDAETVQLGYFQQADRIDDCRNELQALLAALPVAAPAPTCAQWQPIATVPKDGTLVIGALIRDGQIWRVHEMLHNGLAFYTKNGGSLPQMTHWMPAPPTEAL